MNFYIICILRPIFSTIPKRDVLKLHMRPDPEGMDRPAVGVVRGIKNKLVIGTQPEKFCKEAETVIQFSDEFGGIIKITVAYDETISTGFKVTPVI